MAKETFLSAELFAQRQKVQLSYQEIATKRGVTRRTAILHIKSDIKNGYIKRRRTLYKCRRYKRLLDGRNIYELTPKGKVTLGVPPSRKEKERQKNNELLAVLKEWMISAPRKRKNIFQKVLEICPSWWAKNPKILQKTLFLLRKKILKGYRVKAPLRWISSALKDFGAGFRRKQARRYAHICSSLAFKNPSATGPTFSSPYVAEGIGNLATLAKKGLDVSEDAMIFLLRRGFDQLAMASKVLLRIKKKREVQSLNGFLNWLVSLRDPFSVFERDGQKKV
ncbi:MAG: hypothetical protein AAF443_00130 [Chlamydiota bacterium]